MKLSAIHAVMQFPVVALLAIAPACHAPAAPRDRNPPPVVYRDEVRFGLTFEERMALPPEISRLRADAVRRANEIYDPFRSRENAVRNEQMAQRLFTDSKESLLADRNLSAGQLDEIVAEYQTSLGANLRRR